MKEYWRKCTGAGGIAGEKETRARENYTGAEDPDFNLNWSCN